MTCPSTTNYCRCKATLINIVVINIALILLSTQTFAQYTGGSGTEADPWQIAEPNDLLYLANHPNDYNSHFILTADINLAGCDFNTAVIASDTSFTGTFDGDGHVIRNLTIGSGLDYLGLFGRTGPTCEIKNLGVEDVNITSGDYSVGALIGYNEFGTIRNCHATGTVNSGGRSSKIGGLVGRNYYGQIRNCYAKCDVTGTWKYFGGLVGCNEHGSIYNCYAAGKVTGDPVSLRIGGLAGTSSGTISNCYSSCSVTGGHGAQNLGGFVGENYGTISNCYATGTVTGGDGSENLGGLVGNNQGKIRYCYSIGTVTSVDHVHWLGGLVGKNSDYIRNCFWDTQTSDMNDGVGYNDGGTIINLLGRTTAQMQTQSTFTDYGWDFMGETINGVFDHWKIRDRLEYPLLRWQIIGDIAGFNGVNFVDFAMMADAWRSTPAFDNWNSLCDLYPNNYIDWLDLQILIDNWLKRYNPTDIAGSYGVDFTDFAVLANTWQSEQDDANWNILCNLHPDDLIDWLDLKILSDNWLKGL